MKGANEMTDVQKNDVQSNADAASVTSLSGKYITFKLADEVYAFEILKVREIIGMMEITRVPQSDAAIKGVINLRGKVNPVVDLRKIFGMSDTISTETAVIVIVQTLVGNDQFTMGVLVDEVLEVLNVEEADIEPPPNMGDFATTNQEYIMGVAKLEKRVIFLLDINSVFNGEQMNAMVQCAN